MSTVHCQLSIETSIIEPMSFHTKMTLALFLCLYTFFGYAQAQKQRCSTAACDSFRVSSLDKKLKLPSLLRSKDSLYFRYYRIGNVVDIWSEDGVSFNGVVTSYTYKSVDKKGHKIDSPSKYFFTKESLDSLVARKIYELLRRVDLIPTGDSIKDQEWINADRYFCFVKVTPWCICSKQYKNPLEQTLPVFTQNLSPVIKKIDSVLRLRSKRDTFISSLKPNLSYCFDDRFNLRCLKGKKGKEIMQKHYNDTYMDSISDPLNKYLSNTLTNIFAKQQPIKCYTNFILHFSADNLLIKITTDDKFDSKTERQEFKKYHRLIKEAFKDVDLSFVHSELAYKKELAFRDRKIDITDVYGE